MPRVYNGRQQVMLWLRPEQVEVLHELSAVRGVTVSRMVESMIDDVLPLSADLEEDHAQNRA